MAIYFLIALSLRTTEITLKSVFKFLIACLAFEILKVKDMTKRKAIRAILDIQKIHDSTTRVKFAFFERRLPGENSPRDIIIYQKGACIMLFPSSNKVKYLGQENSFKDSVRGFIVI